MSGRHSGRLLLYAQFGVRATGVFELDLLSFKNDGGLLSDGACCRGPKVSGQCSGSCSTLFRICFKHFERELTDASDCTYGEHTTAVVGNNTFDFPKDGGNASTPIKFNFQFAWRVSRRSIVVAAEGEGGRFVLVVARAWGVGR